MAPEILLGPYDNRVDLWSIGVILYGIRKNFFESFFRLRFLECLFGRPPFVFLTIDDLISKIKATFPIEVKRNYFNSWKILYLDSK
jgi:serine/threonine protein kinase